MSDRFDEVLAAIGKLSDKVTLVDDRVEKRLALVEGKIDRCISMVEAIAQETLSPPELARLGIRQSDVSEKLSSVNGGLTTPAEPLSMAASSKSP